MHNCCHNCCHTIKRKILFRNILAYLLDIPKSGKKEASKSANKQRWRKRTTTTTSPISCTGGKNLCQCYQSNIQQQELCLPCKHRTSQHLIPIGFAITFYKKAQAAITFTIKGRKQKDKRRQNQATCQQFKVRTIGKTCISVFAPRHYTHKVK